MERKRERNSEKKKGRIKDSVIHIGKEEGK